MQTIFTSLVGLFVQLKSSLSFQLSSYQALSPTPPLVKQPQLSQEILLLPALHAINHPPSLLTI